MRKWLVILMNKDSIFEESALVASAKEGDSDAFDLLAGRYHGLLYGYISSLGVDESEREDLMQEALVGLLRAVRSYDRDKASFATYVSACVKNSASSYLRRSGRQVRSFPVEDVYSVCDESGGDSPEHIFIDMESTAQLMEKVFSVLSPYEKKVFEMYLAEIPYASIAKRLSKNEKSIDNAIQRIKAKLRKLV